MPHSCQRLDRLPQPRFQVIPIIYYSQHYSHLSFMMRCLHSETTYNISDIFWEQRAYRKGPCLSSLRGQELFKHKVILFLLFCRDMNKMHQEFYYPNQPIRFQLNRIRLLSGFSFSFCRISRHLDCLKHTKEWSRKPHVN